MTAVLPAQRDAEHVDGWELVDRAQAGDRAAFGALYEMHYGLVLMFLVRRVGPGPEAADLAQDVFVRALRGIERIEYRGQAVGAWLITIARNLAMDHFKSGRVRRMVLQGDVYQTPTPDPDPTPDHVAVMADSSRRVRAALALLSGKQRQVLVLRYLNELSITETAAVMNIGEGAVKALTFRAVRTVRRHAQDLGLS